MVTKNFPNKKNAKDIQIAIYVPSTEYEKVISNSEWKKRINETKRFLTRTFGGTTRVKGKGFWKDNKKMINEDVSIVESFTTKKEWEKKDLIVERWLKIKLKSWKQYILSFEFENELYFIEP